MTESIWIISVGYDILKHCQYLGHLIAGEEVYTDSRKVKTVADWPRPANVKQVRSLLGLVGIIGISYRGMEV